MGHFPVRSLAATSMIVAAGLMAVSSATSARVGGITSPTGLTDTIDWTQLGAPYKVLDYPPPYTAVSVGGVTVTLSSAEGFLVRWNQGNGWNGNFAPGEALLSDGGHGPDITLTFATPVSAAGATIQSYYWRFHRRGHSEWNQRLLGEWHFECQWRRIRDLYRLERRADQHPSV